MGESIVGRANGLRARLCQVVHVGAEGWAERTMGGGLWAEGWAEGWYRGLGGEEDCTLIGGGLG